LTIAVLEWASIIGLLASHFRNYAFMASGRSDVYRRQQHW